MKKLKSSMESLNSDSMEVITTVCIIAAVATYAFSQGYQLGEWLNIVLH